MLGVLPLVVSLAAGLALQRTPAGERLRGELWRFSFWGLAPALALTAFLTVELGGDLLRSLAAAGAANWLLLGIAYGYAILVARSREERGCLAVAVVAVALGAALFR